MASEFQLQIVTPDGLLFDGMAERLVTRTTEGDVGILARHSDYVAPLDVGETKIRFADGTTRTASCAKGMVSVSGGVVRLVATTFEWADEIDIDRAQRALEKAKDKLQRETNDYELRMAEFKLKRALNRINVYNKK
ncbi:MAG: ATP synthase F1 subunit epsilon [Clostridia bacterium]